MNPKQAMPITREAGPRQPWFLVEMLNSMRKKSEIDIAKSNLARLCANRVSSKCRKSNTKTAGSMCKKLCIERVEPRWAQSEGSTKEPNFDKPEIDVKKPAWTKLCDGIAKPKCKKSSTNTTGPVQLTLRNNGNESRSQKPNGSEKEPGQPNPKTNRMKPTQKHFCNESIGPKRKKSKAGAENSRWAKLCKDMRDSRSMWSSNNINESNLLTPKTSKVKSTREYCLTKTDEANLARSSSDTTGPHCAELCSSNSRPRCRRSNTSAAKPSHVWLRTNGVKSNLRKSGTETAKSS